MNGSAGPASRAGWCTSMVGVVEVGGERLGGRGDEHRQVPRAAQVGAGHPHLLPRQGGGHEHPAGGGQHRPVVVARGGEHGLGERVARADHDAHVGQVGVGVERRRSGVRSGRVRVAVTPCRARATSRWRTSSSAITSATPMACGWACPSGACSRIAGGRGQPGPGVCGVVEGPQVLGGVDLGKAERAADGRETHVGHRQRAGQVEVEAYAEQPVLPDGAVDVGTEVDPVVAAPQRRPHG